jgi:phosphoenolpyruvate carboxykinase (ATP)
MSNNLTQSRYFDSSYFDKKLVIHHQLSVPQLIEKALENNEGTLTTTGALAVDTGKFTGRSPKDRFIVEDAITKDKVWWSDINIPINDDKFEALLNKVINHLNQKNQIYQTDALACADETYQIGISVYTEYAFQSLFANHLFINKEQNHINTVENWTIIAAPSFNADTKIDGTRQENFSIINFTKRIILIGGTAYTGEIKKGIFSVLNFLLPQKGVLSMHCSANYGENGDTAVFFGLSGTGKTTLSADVNRALIGDDEHGWSENGVFNLEGGCYAKCINLTQESEPEIFEAIKFGALVENTCYLTQSREVDFTNTQKTENTRVAYSLSYIKNVKKNAKGPSPKNIFFLTADAFGVLPPIAKLTIAQAMFYFINGYTAKVAGTESGVIEPQATFSACFGKAFLPLHPTIYAQMLKTKLDKGDVNIWLVNTGWVGGAYGIGERIKLKYTRNLINAALNGNLLMSNFKMDSVFNLLIPENCPNVPSNILNPINNWENRSNYILEAKALLNSLDTNFLKYNVENTEKLKPEMV